MELKRTKLYLQIDLVSQVTIFILTILFILIPGQGMTAIGIFYFGLGTQNLISYFLHLKRRLQTKSNPKVYTLLLVLIGTFGILSLLSTNILMIYLVLLILVGFIMAVSYFIITLNDLNENEK